MYSLPNSRHYRDSEMLYGDYDQEMQRYDAFCYEYYCRLRQSNAALFRAMYENWYSTNNFYPSHYGWSRDTNFNSDFSNSERSSPLIAQSNEEWQKSNEYPATTGLENNRSEIDFHYYDSYFYGFYDTMRKVNPTMYAILYAKWCASHHFPINEVYWSCIPHNIAPGESSHVVRGRFPKDFITTHCDTDGSEILTSDSSAPPETKQHEHLDRSLVEECGQTIFGSGHCGNDRDSTSEVELRQNGGVADGRVLPNICEPGDTKPKQEIKQLEHFDSCVIEECGQIISGSGDGANDQGTAFEVQLNKGIAGDMGQPKIYEPGDTKPRQVIPSELQTSCIAVNNSTNKVDDLSGKKQGKSWINTLLTKMRFSRSEAHLPDDDCPTIVWDNDRKQWVDTATNENSYSGSSLLPPKSSGIAPGGANNVYRLKKSRDVRSKYVDVLQSSKHFSNVCVSNSSEEKSYV